MNVVISGQVNILKLFLQKWLYKFPFHFSTLHEHESLMQSLTVKNENCNTLHIIGIKTNLAKGFQALIQNFCVWMLSIKAYFPNPSWVIISELFKISIVLFFQIS